MAAIGKLILWILAALPLRVVHGIGTAVGWGLVVIPNRRRRTTETNLSLCYPELADGERLRLSRESLIETGRGLTETSALWLRRDDKILPLVKRISGEKQLSDAFAENRGVIMAIPHLGAWEMVGLYCSAHYPTTSLYRPPPIAAMEPLMRQARQRLGARLVPTDTNGIRALYKALSKGEMVCILPDQDPAAGTGVFVPFFGVAANTMVLLSRLASKTQAPVVFAYAERLSKGRGYHLHFLRGAAGINGRNLERSAAEVNRMVEQCVRRLPQQYLWCYKRFRTRPPGEPRLYLK